MGNQRIGISAGQISKSVMAITEPKAVLTYTLLVFFPTPNGASVMTTAIKTAARSQQVREPELTAEDLEQVMGGWSVSTLSQMGSGASKGGGSLEYLTFTMEHVTISSVL